ncbi:MAG: ribosome small subunit-dependent GTPase A [Atopobiaceae bacterium]|nr:ribosome small subunit-dependent GTPase A [Atopobiaceae bacterium]MCH4180173.1 ribosome small subunit-dependent GTPase A [Atopobiaceae bacterium]MCH4214343.1 ribosome small subunit-dependent GTPase A [Atopobiaceae bacterium]MCH4229226.1 ribosome small subunit-dependent GTPase A [Atopobiaceae bacterium]MCH4276597.1 ribosome small subunit-dependent GTPase A [Atopobiaceae bacterium]
MARRRNKHDQGARSRARHSEGAGGAQVALPALSSLLDVPPFDDLASDAVQRAAFAQACERVVREYGVDADELCMGCVVRLDRGFPAVVCASGLIRAEHAARLAKLDEIRPAVGDWVVCRRPPEHDMGVIEEVLPRSSELARWRGGTRGERQTLAANVDVVLVAQQLGDRPLACDRIVRSVVVALDGGSAVAVVLTKADRAGAPGLERDASLVREVLGEGVPVVATAAGADDACDLADAAARSGAAWGTDAVAGLVGPRRVGVVLGESGAGKSTLLNALLGHEALEVGEVRGRDDAGRHTTVARRMVALPQGGVIVDAPGLRSLPVLGHEEGLSRAFPLVTEAAGMCRFRDCTHTSEPGCAVLAACEAGEFPPARLEAYRAIAAEMDHARRMLDPDV